MLPMLGQALYDVSLKRKLYSSFDLPNLIKELNLTHRLANTNRVSNRMKADRRSYNRYKPYTPRSGPFLGRGRGNLP